MSLPSAPIAELTPPRVFLARMIAFMTIVLIIVIVLFFGVETAFSANPALNGLIVAVLLFGVFHTFRQTLELWPEIEWINAYRHFDGAVDHLSGGSSPRLLSPLVGQFKASHESKTSLSPAALRVSLDAVSARLGEGRDLSRYLIGLLIFLGLLGTFWGLLEAITAVGRTVTGLDAEIGGNIQLFEELRAGLEAPLGGMGKAFSSSLFGLSGSLVLGFLDLQVGQAQNRFHNGLEDWLLTAVVDADDRDFAAISDMRRPAPTAGRFPRQERVAGQDIATVAAVAEDIRGLAETLRLDRENAAHVAHTQFEQNQIAIALLERIAQTLESFGPVDRDENP